jgi:hypothetical protein
VYFRDRKIETEKIFLRRFKYDKNEKPIWNDTYEYAILKDEWINL